MCIETKKKKKGTKGITVMILGQKKNNLNCIDSLVEWRAGCDPHEACWDPCYPKFLITPTLTF